MIQKNYNNFQIDLEIILFSDIGKLEYQQFFVMMKRKKLGRKDAFWNKKKRKKKQSSLAVKPMGRMICVFTIQWKN